MSIEEKITHWLQGHSILARDARTIARGERGDDQLMSWVHDIVYREHHRLYAAEYLGIDSKYLWEFRGHVSRDGLLDANWARITKNLIGD